MNAKEVAKTNNKARVYKIERNIPIPELRKELKYPLMKMEVGDSFIVPFNESKHVRGAVARVQRMTDKVFSFCTRTIHGKGKSGKHVRVWRINS